jgi:hypothetical protein
VRDLKTGAISKPLPGLDGVHIDGASINRERTLMAVVTNEDGYGVPHLFRLPSFEPVKLPPIERGVVSLGSLRGNKVQWTLSNARTPGLTYGWTVPEAGQAGGAVKQLTFADTQGVDLAAFPLPELVRYKAFDGLSVPAFLFTPAGSEKGTPIPFVVNYARRARGTVPSCLRSNGAVPAERGLRRAPAQRSRQRRVRSRVPDDGRLQEALGQRARRRGRGGVACGQRIRDARAPSRPTAARTAGS